MHTNKCIILPYCSQVLLLRDELHSRERQMAELHISHQVRRVQRLDHPRLGLKGRSDGGDERGGHNTLIA